jgi:membrane-associated phospholipid phosphatase
MFKSFFILLVLVCAFISAPLSAQTPTTMDIPQPEKSNYPGIVSGLTSDFLSDQKHMWTSPWHVTGSDVKWIAPVAAATGTLFIFDHRISDAARADTGLRTPSNIVSEAGQVAPFAVPGALLLFGALKHDGHASEAGRLGAEAEVDAEVIMQVLKYATNRTRPNLSDNKSFPSGHTMSAFALAAVMSREYHDKPLIRYGSYGFATAVGLARVGGLNHFPSDVLVGAVLGELIGEYVVHHHAQLADSQ